MTMDLIFIGIVATFLAMLIVPLLIAFRSPRNFVNPALAIDGNASTDPRNLSERFRAAQRDKKNEVTSAGLLLKPREEFPALIYTDQKVSVAEACSFTEGLYVKNDAALGRNAVVKTIACDRSLTLARDAVVVEWADAVGDFLVGKNADLGKCATSASNLTVEAGCRFKKLYAPAVYIGAGKRTLKKTPDLHANPTVLRNPLQICDEEIVLDTIITKDDLRVGKRCTIKGSIKSMGDIYIGEDTDIAGNVIAEGRIIIENRCRILGNVFSQGDILVGQNVAVGVPGKIKSCIARRKLTLSKGCMIYGFAEAKEEGRTVTVDRYEAMLAESQ